MYNTFFRFVEKPFEVTPDPKFLYMTRAYQEILSALIYGIHERRGFIAIVGEVGTGKTMMINALLDRLGQNIKVAYIFNSDLTFRQMLMMVLYDLGLTNPDENLSKVDAIHRLYRFAIAQLEKRGNVVIIVDEAQGLSHKTMENLRMLSNLETRKHKLVQIILSGQPELDAKLNRPEWRQLVQRISLKRYATHLSEKDSYSYIRHRLGVAGYQGSPLFSRRALQMIWEFSEGIPRKINILCDNALLIGYGLGKQKIGEKIITEAIEDLSLSPYLNFSGPSTSRNETNPTIYPAPQAPLTQGVPTPGLPTTQKPYVLKIATPHGKQGDATAPEDKPISRYAETSVGVHNAKSNRLRSIFISGLLIMLLLTMATWFLIFKPEPTVSEMSYRDHSTVQVESLSESYI